MATMPAQKPGRSKQDYRTPPEFLAAVKAKLGIVDFAIDLAADAENAVVDTYFDKATDALKYRWACQSSAWVAENELVIPTPTFAGPYWNWLNPEFGDIDPWAKKSYEEMTFGANTAMLIPLSSATWWMKWVHGKCQVLLLGGEENSGRICFVHDWANTIDPATTKPGKGPARCYTQPPLYPKDCALLLYGEPDRFPAGYDIWDWRKEIR